MCDRARLSLFGRQCLPFVYPAHVLIYANMCVYVPICIKVSLKSFKTGGVLWQNAQKYASTWLDINKRIMWKPSRFSCGNLDSMRGCGSIWGKWSCVFADGEMDKFPQIGGRG